ncbi:MAG TPA: DUF1192 family protein [Alphaproteobacteria bacterium]|nr:DUF1192 family protein [Alphaproteobacteria bacterium]
MISKVIFAKRFLTDLGPMSLEGLCFYIQKLELEIQRVQLEIKKKDALKENAEFVFKHNP